MEAPSENYPYYLSILYWDHNYENQSHCVMLSYMDALQKMQPLLESLTLKHNLYYSTDNGPLSHSLDWDIWFLIHLQWISLSITFVSGGPPLLSFLSIKKVAGLNSHQASSPVLHKTNTETRMYNFCVT